MWKNTCMIKAQYEQKKLESQILHILGNYRTWAQTQDLRISNYREKEKEKHTASKPSINHKSLRNQTFVWSMNCWSEMHAWKEEHYVSFHVNQGILAKKYILTKGHNGQL